MITMFAVFWDVTPVSLADRYHVSAEPTAIFFMVEDPSLMERAAAFSETNHQIRIPHES
jgi:hypothetical protein